MPSHNINPYAYADMARTGGPVRGPVTHGRVDITPSVGGLQSSNRAFWLSPSSTADRYYGSSVGGVPPQAIAAAAPIAADLLKEVGPEAKKFLQGVADKAGEVVEDLLKKIKCKLTPGACRNEARRNSYKQAAATMLSESKKALADKNYALAYTLAQYLAELHTVSPFSTWKVGKGYGDLKVITDNPALWTVNVAQANGIMAEASNGLKNQLGEDTAAAFDVEANNPSNPNSATNALNKLQPGGLDQMLNKWADRKSVV